MSHETRLRLRFSSECLTCLKTAKIEFKTLQQFYRGSKAPKPSPTLERGEARKKRSATAGGAAAPRRIGDPVRALLLKRFRRLPLDG